MRRLLMLLLAIAFPMASLAAKVPTSAEQVASMPAPTGYIDDYAGVMTPAGKAELDRICHEIHASTKGQIFVVTIKSLDGGTIQMFANDLFHTWKIGEKKTDRGVLLLFAVAEHKWRIEVGFGLEGVLNDAKVGRIGRDMVPALKDGDYDQAALTGVQSVAEAIAQDAGVAFDPSPAAPAQTLAPPHAASAGGGAIFGMFLVVGFILLIVSIAWRRRRRYYAAGYVREPAIYVAPVEPVIFAAAVPPAFGSGAAAFGPGGNDYAPPSSGGGDSFGGGGGGDAFTGGGGGDSGGGGADGGW